MRGNQDADVRRNAKTGSIPARAGEPPRTVQAACSAWVYPRACEGTSRTGVMGKINLGLSPRVRGNPGSSEPRGTSPGSIPARAGGGLDHAGAQDAKRLCGGGECVLLWSLNQKRASRFPEKDPLGGSLPLSRRLAVDTVT